VNQPKPDFFCEHCGARVPLYAKNCPGCGRVFAAVRCPNCNFTGEEDLFKTGCPACGYVPAAATPPKKTRKKAAAPRTEPLPFWVYAVSGLAALAIVLLILRFLM
jgi:ssDNA-binding Zn-finger/Zn-ribbon topoisomerase 1